MPVARDYKIPKSELSRYILNLSTEPDQSTDADRDSLIAGSAVNSYILEFDGFAVESNESCDAERLGLRLEGEVHKVAVLKHTSSQNIAAQILVLHDARNLLPHILRVDHDHFFNRPISLFPFDDGQRCRCSRHAIAQGRRHCHLADNPDLRGPLLVHFRRARP